MMAARILGLSSLILSASLVSRAQAFPCDSDQGWLAKEDAKCTGTDQTSCSAAQCCEERTCASINATGLACPTGTTAKESPGDISSCSGDDEAACVAEQCCEGMTCTNIGAHLDLACPTETAKADNPAITVPGTWYASCCVLPTCESLVNGCADESDLCTCKAGYDNVVTDGSVFNKQLGSGGDADKFLVQCCVLPTCEASASDEACPEGKKAKVGVGYNVDLSSGFQDQCCEWKTCSEADLACAEGTVASETDTWNADTAADNPFQAACCKTKSCAIVASKQSDVECDGGKTFVEDKQYDSSGSNFDVDAFKEHCCGPIFVCADYQETEDSALIDGGLRTAYPRIVAAAIGGSAMLWGSWAARSAAC